MIDFIKFFDAYTLLVTPDKLGCINETLLNLELLKNRNIPHSWCVNHTNGNEEFKTITLPFYKEKFKKIFSLQDNIEELSSELVTNCNSNRDR